LRRVREGIIPSRPPEACLSPSGRDQTVDGGQQGVEGGEAKKNQNLALDEMVAHAELRAGHEDHAGHVAEDVGDAGLDEIRRRIAQGFLQNIGDGAHDAVEHDVAHFLQGAGAHLPVIFGHALPAEHDAHQLGRGFRGKNKRADPGELAGKGQLDRGKHGIRPGGVQVPQLLRGKHPQDRDLQLDMGAHHLIEHAGGPAHPDIDELLQDVQLQGRQDHDRTVTAARAKPAPGPPAPQACSRIPPHRVPDTAAAWFPGCRR